MFAKLIKYRRWLWLAVASLALSLLIFLMIVPRPVRVDVSVVGRGSFQEWILSDAILRSRDRFTLFAFADGEISRVNFVVGDTVKKGQVIAKNVWDRTTVLRSPVNGVVSRVYRLSAGPVRRGDPILEIVDPKNLEVMAELLTTDAVRLKLGASVIVTDWEGKSQIEARVSRISKAGFVKQSALGVEEERTEVTAVILTPTPAFLHKAGDTYHVEARFNVASIDEALKIPVGALFRDGNNWSVFRVERGRARKTSVVLGGINSNEAHIMSGVNEGMLIVLYPGDLIKDGSRITPNKYEMPTPWEHRGIDERRRD